MARTLLEQVHSPGGKWKADIWKRDDGTLRVALLRYRIESVPEYDHYGGFWVLVDTANSVTDSVDIARTIASDLLRQHAADGE